VDIDKMEKIIVIGGGGHAKVAISIIKKLDKFEIVGFTDRLSRDKILGIPYIGSDAVLKNFYDDGVKNAFIGIGQIKSSKIRTEMFFKLKNIGFNLPNIISGDSILSDNVQLGEGVIIMNGAILEAGCTIGDGCIVNTNSSINHDSNIGSFTHIAPGATICGDVNIGNNVLIGAGTTIIQGLKINDDIIISTGSIVTKSILDSGLYAKNPLRKIKVIKS